MFLQLSLLLMFESRAVFCWIHHDIQCQHYCYIFNLSYCCSSNPYGGLCIANLQVKSILSSVLISDCILILCIIAYLILYKVLYSLLPRSASITDPCLWPGRACVRPDEGGWCWRQYWWLVLGWGGLVHVQHVHLDELPGGAWVRHWPPWQEGCSGSVIAMLCRHYHMPGNNITLVWSYGEDKGKKWEEIVYFSSVAKTKNFSVSLCS